MDGKYSREDCTEIGTYCTVMRQGAEEAGVMYGEGQGVITTKDGQEMATWTGQEIGRFTGQLFILKFGLGSYLIDHHSSSTSSSGSLVDELSWLS